jgi:hypothetical protein
MPSTFLILQKDKTKFCLILSSWLVAGGRVHVSSSSPISDPWKNGISFQNKIFYFIFSRSPWHIQRSTKCQNEFTLSFAPFPVALFDHWILSISLYCQLCTKVRLLFLCCYSLPMLSCWLSGSWPTVLLPLDLSTKRKHLITELFVSKTKSESWRLDNGTFTFWTSNPSLVLTDIQNLELQR